MVEAIPESFVLTWENVQRCGNSRNEGCETGVTETMLYNYWTEEYYCAICSKDMSTYRCEFKETDAKFKCPEGRCNSSLSFREFLDAPCCTAVRTEFQDLKKMMNVLEISEKKDKIAKEEMDLKQKRLEDATLIFSEKDEKRNESRKKLAEMFADAEDCFNNFDRSDEKSKFKDLRNLMDQYEIIAKEQEEAEKKMEEERTAFEEAAKEYGQKKENCDIIRCELSSSLTETGQSLAQNQEMKVKPRDKCNVCFEKYNIIDRHFCVLQCGHPTCQKCLNEMPEKLCPICRETFTENNIIKLFFN